MGYNRPMSRSSALILFGFFTVLIPFSGLPVSIRTVLSVIAGACVVGIGFSLRPTEQRASVERAPEPVSEPAPAAPPEMPSPMA